MLAERPIFHRHRPLWLFMNGVYRPIALVFNQQNIYLGGHSLTRLAPTPLSDGIAIIIK